MYFQQEEQKGLIGAKHCATSFYIDVSIETHACNVSNVLKHRSGPVTAPLNIPHCPSIISVTRVLAAHTPHTAAIILCIYDYEVRTRQHASNVNVKSRMYDDMLHNIMLKRKI